MLHVAQAEPALTLALALTDAPEPMEPADGAREVAVEGWVWGSQEIQKYKELLQERQPRLERGGQLGWILPPTSPLPPGPSPAGALALTMAWILVGPGLWGMDSMSLARCRDPYRESLGPHSFSASSPSRNISCRVTGAA